MRIAIGLYGIFLAAVSVGGSEPLKMSVSPAQSIAPANLFIRLSIEPQAANRLVEVEAEFDRFYRSSQISLEGDHGPRTVVLEFRALPGGQYRVRSVVADDKGREVAAVQREVNVLDAGGR